MAQTPESIRDNILQSFTLAPRIAEAGLEFTWNEDLGFLQLDRPAQHAGEVTLLGTGVILGDVASDGDFDQSPTTYPKTEFNEVHKNFRQTGWLGKGIDRLYNSSEAAHGMLRLPNKKTMVGFGAYLFSLDTRYVHDNRQDQGGHAKQVGTHGGRIVSAKKDGLQTVVNGIHEDYSNNGYEAVLFKQPIRAWLRQYVQRGISQPPSVDPEFIVFNNRNTRLTLIGHSAVRSNIQSRLIGNL